ncbi:hypothetical protein [Acanthopleuribacter pedis]|uniref:Uncharacterized protein n=1 Tax=Acanthopleuribacter pedis TaxID=442870 RepID=A0A8J7QUD4_9BACT|nr:hypothetical protein [Acanthopleuribacter pedis]MBO1323348.1 hypothetical protein [Acanthopleuribacter pedis]
MSPVYPSLSELGAALAEGPDALKRRAGLVAAMAAHEQDGVDCSACSGVCCTFVANSMQTTPLETYDLLVWLQAQQRIDADLVAHLKETVRRYRLDAPDPGDGRRSFVRRTYTCPFFKRDKLGCTISRQAKPYGCLGFNPFKAGQVEGGECRSQIDLLERREAEFAAREVVADQVLRRGLALDWEKKPMPVALLEFIDKLALAD